MNLKRGQVWRYAGPYNWLRVRWIMLPGFSEYDGGAPGVSFDRLGANGKRKLRNGCFMLAKSEGEMIKTLRAGGRYCGDEKAVAQ